ncbi:MAG: helix-turn-helix domain-containing protein [Pseudomonadales bacterium]
MVTKRDPPGVQKRILDAAARVFATQGPAGARIDVIAAEAGVNKRMLYHYFGAKQDLFAAVIDDRLGTGLNLPGASGLLSDGAPMALMDLRLMVWATIAGVELGVEQASRWEPLLTELAQEQHAGRLRDDVDPGLIALVLLAGSALPDLLGDCAKLAVAADGQFAAQLRILLQPGPVGHSRGDRPRVRMMPEVRHRG